MKLIAQLVLILSIQFGCQRSESLNDVSMMDSIDVQLLHFPIENRDLRIDQRHRLDEGGLHFGYLLFPSHNYDSLYTIIDQQFCQVVVLDREMNIKAKLAANELLPIEFCPSSAVHRADTTYVYFRSNAKIGVAYNNAVQKVIHLQWHEQLELTSENLPVQLLPNGDFLLPSGENIMRAPDWVRSNSTIKDLKKHMRNERLFSVFDPTGNFERAFGYFPKEYQIEGISSSSPKPFFFTVLDSTIFVAFQLSNQLFEYHIDGRLLHVYDLGIPEMKQEVSKKASETYSMYVVKGLSVTPNRRQFHVIVGGRHAPTDYFNTYLYRFDLDKERAYKYPIAKPLRNFELLPIARDLTIDFLERSMDVDEKWIYTLKL
jgi:hypothetical protein